MITPHQEHLVSLLLASFPNFSSGDADAALAAYSLVISKAADPRDVEAGVTALINGEVAGFDGRFAPTATQLARAIREALERRVDAENAARRRLPPPAEEWAEPTPEQKARVKALMDKVRRDYGSERDDADHIERHRAQLRRTNERFDREAMSYSTVNTAEDDVHDMGQARAS